MVGGVYDYRGHVLFLVLGRERRLGDHPDFVCLQVDAKHDWADGEEVFTVGVGSSVDVYAERLG